MPHKDPIIAAVSKHAYYLAHKEQFYQSGKRRREHLKQEAKAKKEVESLISKPPIQRTCVDCSVDITFVYTPKKGVRCKRCIFAYHKAYREANAEKIAARKVEWKQANKEHVAVKNKKYAEANPEKRTQARKKWITNNPGKDTAAKALNAQLRKKRIPTWLSGDEKWMIEQAYELAALRTKLFGFQWHVDHIIPLNGKRVSGLHTPYNLQVIPAIDNLRKSNRMEIA
jgi:hypothetical protein